MLPGRLNFVTAKVFVKSEVILELFSDLGNTQEGTLQFDAIGSGIEEGISLVVSFAIVYYRWINVNQLVLYRRPNLSTGWLRPLVATTLLLLFVEPFAELCRFFALTGPANTLV